MVELIKRHKQAVPGAPSREAAAINKKRAAHAALNSQFAALAKNPTPPRRGTHVLAGQPITLPASTQKAASDPMADAPEHVKRLALRHGPDAGKLMLAMHRRSQEEGDHVVNFDGRDAADVMGGRHDSFSANQFVAHLVTIGALREHKGPTGIRRGYQIVPPAY